MAQCFLLYNFNRLFSYILIYNRENQTNNLFALAKNESRKSLEYLWSLMIDVEIYYLSVKCIEQLLEQLLEQSIPRIGKN